MVESSHDGWITIYHEFFWWSVFCVRCLNHHSSPFLMVKSSLLLMKSPFLMNSHDFLATCHRRAHLATRLGSGPGANWTLKETLDAMERCASSMVQTQVTPLKWQLWIGSFYIFGILQPNQVGGLEHDFFFPIILGMSSSQLTNSYFFERGRYTTNQNTC